MNHPRILISQFNMIGDVVLSSALLDNLKHQIPDAKITYTTYDFNYEVIKNNPNIDDIILYHKERLNPIQKLLREIRFFMTFVRKRHDIFICLRDSTRGRFLGILTGAKKRITFGPSNRRIFTDITKPDSFHAVDRDLSILQALGLKILHKQNRVYWCKEDEEHVRPLIPNGQFVQVHPVARWSYKEIPAKVVKALIEKIYHLGYQIVITGSRSLNELNKIENLTKQLDVPVVNLWGKLSLSQLSYLSSKASVFVGCDTASMHIAAATNTPVVAWFGPSKSHNWGPWDNSLMSNPYKNKGGVQQMGRHTLISLQKACLPCDQRGCGHSGISQCLEEMSVDHIWPYVEQKLKGT